MSLQTCYLLWLARVLVTAGPSPGRTVASGAFEARSSRSKRKPFFQNTRFPSSSSSSSASISHSATFIWIVPGVLDNMKLVILLSFYAIVEIILFETKTYSKLQISIVLKKNLTIFTLLTALNIRKISIFN